MLWVEKCTQCWANWLIIEEKFAAVNCFSQPIFTDVNKNKCTGRDSFSTSKRCFFQTVCRCWGDVSWWHWWCPMLLLGHWRLTPWPWSGSSDWYARRSRCRQKDNWFVFLWDGKWNNYRWRYNCDYEIYCWCDVGILEEISTFYL